MPDSEVVVQKNGKDIAKERVKIQVKEDTVTVQFTEVELIDSGEYSIKATNTEGSCLCTSKIEVIESN